MNVMNHAYLRCFTTKLYSHIDTAKAYMKLIHQFILIKQVLISHYDILNFA